MPLYPDIPNAPWIDYTPTLIQSGAVTKTVDSARYMKIGRTVVFEVHVTCTGAGTGAVEVQIGLPLTAAYAANRMCGAGFIFDSSASVTYKGLAILRTTTAVALLPTNTTTNGNLGADTFTAALASPDQLLVSGVYEAAA